MLACMTMAVRKPEPADPNRLVPFTFRIPEGLVSALDEWLEEQNATRRGSSLTRSDLIRGVLTWASETKPAWEPGKFIIELRDATGRTIARRRVRESTGGEVIFPVDGRQLTGVLERLETSPEGEPVAVYLFKR